MDVSPAEIDEALVIEEDDVSEDEDDDHDEVVGYLYSFITNKLIDFVYQFLLCIKNKCYNYTSVLPCMLEFFFIPLQYSSNLLDFRNFVFILILDSLVFFLLI